MGRGGCTLQTVQGSETSAPSCWWWCLCRRLLVEQSCQGQSRPLTTGLFLGGRIPESPTAREMSALSTESKAPRGSGSVERRAPKAGHVEAGHYPQLRPTVEAYRRGLPSRLERSSVK
jgi:hypothetical protein